MPTACLGFHVKRQDSRQFVLCFVYFRFATSLFSPLFVCLFVSVLVVSFSFLFRSVLLLWFILLICFFSFSSFRSISSVFVSFRFLCIVFVFVFVCFFNYYFSGLFSALVRSFFVSSGLPSFKKLYLVYFFFVGALFSPPRTLSCYGSRPHTGRRHQLRLHALHVGHPILGDATYATATNAAADIPRMCLHAHSLRLRLAPRDTASLKGAPSENYGDEGAAAAAGKAAEAGAATEVVVAKAGTAGGLVVAAAGATTRSATAVEGERRTTLKRKGQPPWRANAGRGGSGGADGEGTIFEIVAPDPFVFVDGELQL